MSSRGSNRLENVLNLTSIQRFNLPPLQTFPKPASPLPPLRTVEPPPVASHLLHAFAQDMSQLKLETNMSQFPPSGLPSPSTESDCSVLCTTPYSRPSSGMSMQATSYKRPKRQTAPKRWVPYSDTKHAPCNEHGNCVMPCSEKKHREQFKRQNQGDQLQHKEDFNKNAYSYKPFKEQSQSNGQTSGLEADKEELTEVDQAVHESIYVTVTLLARRYGLEDYLKHAISTKIEYVCNNRCPWTEHQLPANSIMAGSADKKCVRVGGHADGGPNACKTHTSPEWRHRSSRIQGKRSESEPDWRICRTLHRADNMIMNMTALQSKFNRELGASRNSDSQADARFVVKLAIDSAFQLERIG